jgi:hypothetical protein
VCSFLLFVPGCSSASPALISLAVYVETVEAKVEVPVSCIDKVPDTLAFLVGCGIAGRAEWRGRRPDLARSPSDGEI